VDQISLWPNDAHPQYLIFCNEEGTAKAGLQRLNLATGAVDTIVTGTTSCDPTRRTPWGTILFGEEAGGGSSGGRVYELIDPVHTTGVTVDRTTGIFSGGTGTSNLVARPALGRLSFEGLGILPGGVTYFGDENRPSAGTAGGACFKFIPTTPFDSSSGPITSLDQSPYADGSIFGLRPGLRGGATDYGQGTETGFGTWVSVCAAGACSDFDLRAAAASEHHTGYYGPEDGNFDIGQLAQGNVRYCNTNSGNESDDQLWGEVVCLADGSVAQAEANTRPGRRCSGSSRAIPAWPCRTTSRFSRVGETGSCTRTQTPRT